MDKLKKFFPISFKYTADGTALAIGIILYVILGIVFGAVIALSGFLTSWIPVVGDVIGILLNAVSMLAEAYVVGGIVIQVLVFCKVIKE